MASNIISSSRVSSVPYKVYYRKGNSTSADDYVYVGEIEAAQGVTVRKTRFGQAIQVNSLGELMKVEEIHQGYSLFLDFILRETRTEIAQSVIFQEGVNPAVADSDVDPFRLPYPGQLMVENYAGGIVLEPHFPIAHVPSWNAAFDGVTPGNAIMQFPCALLASDQETSFALKAAMNEVPIVLEVFPYLKQVGGSPDPLVDHYRMGEYISAVPTV